MPVKPGVALFAGEQSGRQDSPYSDVHADPEYRLAEDQKT